MPVSQTLQLAFGGRDLRSTSLTGPVKQPARRDYGCSIINDVMQSSNPVESIRTIQREYVRHVRSFWGPIIDEFLASGSKWVEYGPDLMRRFASAQGLLIPFRGRLVTRDFGRILEFIAANREFWSTNSNPLAQALREVGLFSIGGSRHLSAPDLAARQLLYFDSLMLPDTSFQGDEVEFFETAPMSALTNVVSQVLIVGTFAAALAANTDFPLVVFYPEHFYKDDPTNPDRIPAYDDAVQESYLYCEEVFGIKLSRERFALMPWDDTQKFTIRLQSDEIESVIPAVLKTAENDPAFRDYPVPKGIYHHALSGTVSADELRYILLTVATEQHQLMIGEANANRFSFDHAHGKHNFFLSQFTNKHRAMEWAEYVPLQESEVASYAFQTEFKWLDQFSLSDAVKLRESDVTQEMRKQLRISRSVLRKATLEGFPSAARAFESEVRRHVSGAAADTKKVFDDARRKLKLSALSFAGSTVLAVASTAFPPLAPAAIASTIASLALGGSSLRDVINAHLAGKRQRSELLQRPVAFLADALARGSKNDHAR